MSSERKLVLGLIVFVFVALFVPSCTAQTLPGSWQWTAQAYDSQAVASAAFADAVNDPRPALLVQTSDGRVPFIVFRWQFVDFWCCTPPFTEYFIGGESLAKNWYSYWSSGGVGGTVRRGIVTTGNTSVAVAWRTYN